MYWHRRHHPGLKQKKKPVKFPAMKFMNLRQYYTYRYHQIGFHIGILRLLNTGTPPARCRSDLKLNFYSFVSLFKDIFQSKIFYICQAFLSLVVL